MLILIPAYLVAFTIPVISLWIIYKLDFYKTGEYGIIALSFLAGVVAFWLASEANRITINQGWLPRLEVIRYSAPIIEEILKGLILWYLISRPRFTYFVEGAVYGFAAGIGFAIVENFQYIQGAQAAGLVLALSRVISTNLMHAAATSILGIFLGQARFERTWLRRLLVGLLGLSIAMLLHVGFNNLVTRVGGGLLLLYAAAAGLAAAGLITYVIKRGLKSGKTWLEESLGMTDRVTSGEAAVVIRMESVDDILKPLAERFGNKKAAEIKDFLTKQARLGFMRKSVERLSEERMKRATEEEIIKLRAQVDEARRKVGSYAMLFLRHTFPEDSSPLWGRLETLIQERTAARPASGGMNLWANLQSRQEEQKNQPKQENQE
jgi:RsiW-degrading membrane proteinase PrsW (M82 family)